MSRILAVGIATLDIINTVASFPAEDDEVRAISQHKTRGGNATNTLTVLSQLGHDCSWAGVLVNEPDAASIEQALAKHHIDTQYCQRLSTGKMPTSYITLNQASGSRTIVHHRDCPEYDFASFSHIDLSQFDWVHFEGRNCEQTQQMLHHLNSFFPTVPYSIEIEKPREDIELLFDSKAQLMMFSRAYAISQGYENAADFLQNLPVEIQQATCSWGEQGCWYKESNTIAHQAAAQISHVVDTLAAGDTFNAGLIDGLVHGRVLADAVAAANQLAGKKCAQQGLENLLTN
jgi:ketohexokinase